MPKANPLTRAINKTKNHDEATSEQKISLVDKKATPKYREGRVLVGAHFARAVSIQIKVIAAEKQITVQAAMAEALNMLFAKYGKPEIADITAGVKE